MANEEFSKNLDFDAHRHQLLKTAKKMS